MGHPAFVAGGISWSSPGMTKCRVKSARKSVANREYTAGPSTALRSGRDDNFARTPASQQHSQIPTPKQNCQSRPKRSAVEGPAVSFCLMKAGCPIQARFWLEGEPQHSTCCFCHDEQSACQRQVEKEITLQNRDDARPGGPVVKTSAQPGRAGDQSRR
jgi:hypothetical protein